MTAGGRWDESGGMIFVSQKPRWLGMGSRVAAWWMKAGISLTLCFMACACASRQGANGASIPAAADKPMPGLPWHVRASSWVSSGLGKVFPKKEQPPRALEPHLLGEIKQVNQENGFVLLDASISSAASEGDELLCVADNRQTAVLRMTSLRSASFLIADIASGKPGVGDRVYRK